MMIEILIYCHQCHHIGKCQHAPSSKSCLLSVESRILDSTCSRVEVKVEVEVMESAMWHAIMVSDRNSICASSARTVEPEPEPEPGRSRKCQGSNVVARAKLLSYD